MAKQKKPAPEEVLTKKSKKSDDEAAPPRSARIDAMIADIQKKMRGRAVLMPASEYSLPYLTKRLPTGLLTLDLELKGGWASGGVNQIIGRKNAGKTALMWMTIRQLQYFLGKKMKVLMAMTEIPADRGQGRMLGARVSMGAETIKEMSKARVENGWPPFSKEEIADLMDEVGTIHELHAMAVEDFYDIILRSVEENMYHLIVIDSIGNALSAAEQENESVHDKVYGGIAAPNTTFLKKLTNLLTMKTQYGEVRDTCVIGINQVRDDVKNPNKQYKAPGGNSLEHAKLVDVYVESGKFLGEEIPVYGPEGTKKKWTAHGKEVNWRIEKGKAGLHEGARGTYVYDFRINNVDYYTDTLIAGVTNGVIEASGAWLGIPDPNNAGKYLMRANGQPKFIEYLALDAQQKATTEEMSFMDYIRDQCFRKNNINISYDWGE
jgi:RecA/RadA recombinase